MRLSDRESPPFIAGTKQRTLPRRPQPPVEPGSQAQAHQKEAIIISHKTKYNSFQVGSAASYQLLLLLRSTPYTVVYRHGLHLPCWIIKID